MVKIFNLFKRKNDVQTQPVEVLVEDPKIQVRHTLEAAKNSLEKIEAHMYDIQEQNLFMSLIAFVAYYMSIIGFYMENMEVIISVNDLLLFKYIDMINDILGNFDEKYATQEQKQEFINTLHTMNEKLYTTVKNIKEQQALDLNVDLKTIRDLIKLDF